MQPDFQIIEDLFCLRLLQCDTLVWWRSARFLLDRMELRDATDGFIGDGRPLRPVNINKLTPDMGHAGHLSEVAGTIENHKPSITIRMHPTSIFCEVIFGMLPFAVWRELIPADGWRNAAPWAFIPAISPQPCCRSLAGAGCQHFHRGVVCKDRLSGQNMAANSICQRFQKRGGLAYPICQR